MRFLLAAAAALAAALSAAAADEAPKGAVPGASPAYLAKVNGRTITVAEYEEVLVATVRNKFYHRAPPEGELAAVRREVADSMILRILSADEARRRGLKADEARVARELERQEARARNMPGWAEHREAVVARWRKDVEERALAEQLEKAVREGVDSPPEAVRRFYDENPALFTEPEKVRLGIILLRVDPSAGRPARERAREEAQAVRDRLLKGADFAELARIHSGDPSAAKGGDAGFLHRGALPGPVQEVIDKLPKGEPSAPIDVLEGVAVVRVIERQPGGLHKFSEVQDRAEALLRRKRAEEAWVAEGARLRAGAKVELGAHYPGIPAAPAGATTGQTPSR